MTRGQLLRWVPLLRLRYIVVPALLWIVIAITLFYSRHPQQVNFLVQSQRQRLFGSGNVPQRMPATSAVLPELAPRIACYGPRDRLLSNSPDDELHYEELSDTSYPIPFLGSQRELGIPSTWMTADGRYGPYGLGENEVTYNRSKVNWTNIDWGNLQDDCLARNAARFPNARPSVRFGDDVRFKPKRRSSIPPTPQWNAFNNTRRTALILRGYSNFKYTDEDLWHIRSLIVETTLKTGGEYAVVLLVHVQGANRHIFETKENYEKALDDLNIPPELRSITVLWDDELLESWYENVGEHRTMWQANQPLQLFALHYPEFDHYWQLELDQRFLGDAGEYLDAVAKFARKEPRKQALERATYAFNEELYGTYDDFMHAVDIANDGKSRAWGPIEITDVRPIGPVPPFQRAEDDEFMWGVGEEADVIVTSFCADVLQTSWVFRPYIENFWNGVDTPRWFCPPAVMRGSRSLLLAVHQAQHEQGLSIPSESVLPSWALWHGLKLSYPPQPAYMRPHESQFEDLGDDWTRDPSKFLNRTATPWFGNDTDHSPDGLSHGNPQSFADRGMTFWWTADYPRQVMDAWFKDSTSRHDDQHSLPGILVKKGGKVYMPNMAMHPVKTNS